MCSRMIAPSLLLKTNFLKFIVTQLAKPLIAQHLAYFLPCGRHEKLRNPNMIELVNSPVHVLFSLLDSLNARVYGRGTNAYAPDL